MQDVVWSLGSINKKIYTQLISFSKDLDAIFLSN